MRELPWLSYDPSGVFLSPKSAVPSACEALSSEASIGQRPLPTLCTCIEVIYSNPIFLLPSQPVVKEGHSSVIATAILSVSICFAIMTTATARIWNVTLQLLARGVRFQRA